MNKIKHYIKLTSIFLFSLVFCLSCQNSYDSMFQNLNNNFIEIGQAKPIPNIGDEDFNEEMMIPQFQYTLKRDCNICLSAPKGAATYEWLIELPHASENSGTNSSSSTAPTRTLIKRSVSQSSTLYYTPSEQIKIGILYILTLNATTKEGTVYTDDAEMIFYE